MDDLLPRALGENYGRATNDPFWDTIHVLGPGQHETTLCGESVADVAQACSLESGRKPTAANGCWTCLYAVQRLEGEDRG